MDAGSLLAYGAACGLLGRILRPGVDRDLLRQCARDRVIGTWPIGCAGAEGRAGIGLLGEALEALDEASLGEIERDNTELFIGPENPVPMWESVWTTEEGLLFAACEADVGQAFARFGVAAPAGEPADHLAYEWSFLAVLLARAGQAAEAGDDARVHCHLEAAATFLASHLGRWGAECLREIGQRAATGFYRGTALVGADCLASLRTSLARFAPEQTGS